MERSSSILWIVLILLFVPMTVYGWGAATHVYFAHELGNNNVLMDLQEMYGAVLPDFPNLMFGSPYQEYLWTQTHYEFMKIVDLACFGRKKAFAYGFASHSEMIGADYTAHIKALTLVENNGYVPIKVASLLSDVEWRSYIEAFLSSRGITDPNLVLKVATLIADTSIESAVDYLISRNEDPEVGIQMVLSSQLRSLFVPSLLANAYARDLAAYFDISVFKATLIIYKAESEFKKYMGVYGGILSQDNALDLMAQQGAELGVLLLANSGININITSDELIPLLKFSLEKAIFFVQPDYSLEIAKTKQFVEANLKNAGIETYIPWYLAFKPVVDESLPVEFSLNQNYPNPFNPTTTIEYTIPAGASEHVILNIYDQRGALVNTLVDQVVSPGFHSLTWNGTDEYGNKVSSGVYIYKLQAGEFVKTRKMLLVR